LSLPFFLGTIFCFFRAALLPFFLDSFSSLFSLRCCLRRDRPLFFLSCDVPSRWSRSSPPFIFVPKVGLLSYSSLSFRRNTPATSSGWEQVWGTVQTKTPRFLWSPPHFARLASPLGPLTCFFSCSTGFAKIAAACKCSFCTAV